MQRIRKLSVISVSFNQNQKIYLLAVIFRAGGHEVHPS